MRLQAEAATVARPKWARGWFRLAIAQLSRSAACEASAFDACPSRQLGIWLCAALEAADRAELSDPSVQEYSALKVEAYSRLLRHHHSRQQQERQQLGRSSSTTTGATITTIAEPPRTTGSGSTGSMGGDGTSTTEANLLQHFADHESDTFLRRHKARVHLDKMEELAEEEEALRCVADV